ncbi:MAG: MBL fold metallo-hydrolase [Myxococcaceae bacterium]|jgi:glyoxylase-like metal-dependent hydrolase (beta-lactamase superfamily II)|nr:MBL fold metallo-hydrolase [Myxococcaceae bacterium]
MRSALLFPIVLATACADVSGIQNQKAYGPATAMIDLFTSCYLLKTEAGPVMVDACWRPEELRARLRENGVAPEDVRTVLLTHAHQDHVGGLPLLPNARLFALPEEQPVVDQYAKRPIDEALTDGQVLTFGSTEVRVYAVPGHTAGSAVFLAGTTLLLGDNALITARGALGPVPRDRSADPDQNIRSMVAVAERLEAEGRTVEWLAPAHSGGVAAGSVLKDFVNANR